MTEVAQPEKSKKKRARGKGAGEAEKLVQYWLELQGYRVHRAARAGFTFFKKKDGSEGAFSASNDLWGALDVVGIQRGETLETWGIQVTTQSGLSARRAKVAAIAWPYTWRISLVSHEPTPDPTNRARKIHHLRIEDLCEGRWLPAVAVRIDMAAIEAHKKAHHPSKPRKPRAPKQGPAAGGVSSPQVGLPVA